LFLLRKIKPAIESEVTIIKERNGNNVDFVNHVCINNVNQSIKLIREQSVILRNLENNGDIIIIGGLYSVETGVVTFFDL
jgi:carbonic anhydrase